MTMTSVTGSKRKPRRGGFTLIELGLVVLILALMLALAAPRFARSYRNALLGEAARTFATTCQWTRLNAVTQQRNATLAVGIGQQAYWVSQPVSNLEQETFEPVCLKRVEMGPGIRIVSASLADGSASGDDPMLIHFYPNGTCDGARVTFRGREEGDTITVILEAATGRVWPLAAEKP